MTAHIGQQLKTRASDMESTQLKRDLGRLYVAKRIKKRKNGGYVFRLKIFLNLNCQRDGS